MREDSFELWRSVPALRRPCGSFLLSDEPELELISSLELRPAPCDPPPYPREPSEVGKEGDDNDGGGSGAVPTDHSPSA